MVDRIIPDRSQSVGIPGQYAEEWPDSSNAFLAGHLPAVTTTDEVAPASVNWPALSPVTKTNGVLALAAPGTPAIGLTVIPIVHGAGEVKSTPVYRTGCVNPDMIAWPAAYDTYEKKASAFDGAPSPTQFIVRPVQGFTEVAPFAP